MKQLNRQKGTSGEERAEEFLRKNGYKIIDKNNFTKFGEIDLIVAKDDILVFVEVKLKSTEDFGTPEEMIDLKKLTQIKRMAEMYLLNHPEIARKFTRYQIDAVCIVEETGRLTHYENIGF